MLMPIQIRIRIGIKTMAVLMLILSQGGFTHDGKSEYFFILFLVTALPVYKISGKK
jgi:hypothetical protein